MIVIKEQEKSDVDIEIKARENKHMYK